MAERKATVERATKETRVTVELELDGSGQSSVKTGIGMLDHMLDQLARHGFFDLSVSATGDLGIDPHHTVEDVAICLGRAFSEALGDKAGIARFGHFVAPMDEALALVSIDLSGRGYACVEAAFSGDKLGELPAGLVSHFLQTLAYEGRFTLHVSLLRGEEDHHRIEAIFKALAKALDAATRPEERARGQVPSTKGVIEGA